MQIKRNSAKVFENNSEKFRQDNNLNITKNISFDNVQTFDSIINDNLIRELSKKIDQVNQSQSINGYYLIII
jgi:hypothetical protein